MCGLHRVFKRVHVVFRECLGYVVIAEQNVGSVKIFQFCFHQTFRSPCVCIRVISKSEVKKVPVTFCSTDYLSRIITSHSAFACDGHPLRLHCPRHSTISIHSAFYGSSEAQLCLSDPPHPTAAARNHSCSAFTALQVLILMCSTFAPSHTTPHVCYIHLSLTNDVLWLFDSSFHPVGVAGFVFDPFFFFCAGAEAAVGVSEPKRLPAACQPPAFWAGPLSGNNQIPPCGLQM